jgi:hypothetical protein
MTNGVRYATLDDMPRASLVGAALAALAAACASVAPASAGERVGTCGPIGYSYAGLASREPAHGVAARITTLSQPNVRYGHVAAWVGVGGPGAGPNDEDEWLQVGVSAFPFPNRGPSLYYELTLPGKKPKYTTLNRDVRPGSSHDVAVLELADRPDYWRVWVSGSPMTPPIYLPASHGRFPPIATAESWNGGSTACNGYGFRFDGVKVAAPGGSWKPLLEAGMVLQDPGYRVKVLGRSSFLAGRG